MCLTDKTNLIYSYLVESFKLWKYYLITACMKYNPALGHWMPTSQSRKFPYFIKGSAFTWGHHLIVCTCVAGFGLLPGVVRVFAVLRYYAAYVLFVYRRFGTNDLPNLQGAEIQLSSSASKIKFTLNFKNRTNKLCRNFGNQRPNFAA